VFYGWQGIERHHPERAQRLRRTFEPLMRQSGIAHLGRISHLAVADQFRRAGVWAYPCSFRETSCISAMKAQAGGAIPVVIPTGALRESVRFGFMTARSYDDLDEMECGGDLVDEWVDGLIEVLRSPERQLRIRRQMIPASKAAYTWARVADGWEQEFSSR
jgi:protein O-GlcNAc transferase